MIPTKKKQLSQVFPSLFLSQPFNVDLLFKDVNSCAHCVAGNLRKAQGYILGENENSASPAMPMVSDLSLAV